MSDTLFVKNSTKILATWLNDANTNTYSAANKAALVLLTPALGLKVFVSSSDGGLFKAVVGAAATTYADNGGAYCGTITIPTGGDGSIAWVRDYSGAINTAWFGVVADGVVDDHPALQALLSQIHTSEFYYIVGQQGTIRITANLIIPNAPSGSAISSSFRFEGISARGTVFDVDGANLTGIQLGDTAHATINTEDDTFSANLSHFSMKGNDSAKYGIRGEWRYNRVIIEDVYAYGFTNTGIAQNYEFSDPDYVEDSKAWGWTLKDCKAQFNKNGFLVSSHQTALNNCVGQYNDYGYVQQRGVSATLTDCDFTANALYEMDIRDFTSLSIVGLYCEFGYNTTFTFPGEGSTLVTPHPAIRIAPTALSVGVDIAGFMKSNNNVTSYIEVDTTSFDVYKLNIENVTFGAAGGVTAPVIIAVTGTGLYASNYIHNYAANGIFTAVSDYTAGFNHYEDIFGAGTSEGLFKYTLNAMTLTATGFSDLSSVSGIRYLKYGKLVTIFIEDLTVTGTSNTTGFTLGTLPSTIIPSVDAYMSGMWGTDNGTNIDTVRVKIDTAGLITMNLDATTGGSGWTASGIKRLRGNVITYLL